MPALFPVLLPLQATRPCGLLLWERRLCLDMLPLFVAIDSPKPKPQRSRAGGWVVVNVGLGKWEREGVRSGGC